MNNKTDPFTRTPGVAGKAYIDNGVADEIIRSFLDEASSKYVYKITGLRGSGKSVEYSRVIQAIKRKRTGSYIPCPPPATLFLHSYPSSAWRKSSIRNLQQQL